MEINTLVVVLGIAVIVVGPGSGVWVGVRAGLSELRRDNARMHETLVEIRDQLRVLNGRVTSSEGHITKLESMASPPQDDPKE